MDRSPTPPPTTSVTPFSVASRHSSSPTSPTTPTATSHHHHQRRRSSNTMEHAYHLPIPPAPTASDLPMDRELLQRWSSNNTPNGTPASQRVPSYPKRHASFDSPREVPLPSPSLSLSSGNTTQQPPSYSFYFANFASSGTTPSAANMASSSHASKLSGVSPRIQDVSSDYFPTQPCTSGSSTSASSLLSHQKQQQAQSSPASTHGSSSRSGSSSSQSRLSSFSSPRGGSGYFDAGRYAVYDDERNAAGSGSDWTSQTSSQPPSPKAYDDDDDVKNGDRHCSKSSTTTTTPGRTHGGHFDASGPTKSMTHKSSQPLSPTARTTTIATPIFPHNRPYSLPSAHSNSKVPTQSHSSQSPPQPQTLTQSQSTHQDSQPTHWPDRGSSASLPLPAQVPFHTLPKASGVPGTERSYDSLGFGAGLGFTDRDYTAHAAWVRQEHRSEVGDKLKKHQQQENNNPYGYNHPSSSKSSSSEGTGSASASPPALNDDPPDPLTRPPPPQTTTSQRTISPFRAPARPSTSPSHTTPEYQPSAMPTAQVYRSHSHMHHTPRNSNNNASTGPAVFSATSSSMYPVPEPPTILPLTAAPGPFLSHAPPPPDTWIEVETTQSEYRLVLRLPGFNRDGITLATKRRRILHIVADRWESGGGHFERRISFGYDADLMQVRAEFDGEMLRISIPRRLPPVELRSSSRPGPVGRLG